MNASDFTRASEIWSVLIRYMPRGRWVPLGEIYELVARHLVLKPGDFEPSAPGFPEPKWKRNVRNVLQRRKALGDILWDGHAHYRLPDEL